MSTQPHCHTCQCNPHRRVGPGTCACGWNAEKNGPFFCDWGDALAHHLRANRAAR